MEPDGEVLDFLTGGGHVGEAMGTQNGPHLPAEVLLVPVHEVEVGLVTLSRPVDFAHRHRGGLQAGVINVRGQVLHDPQDRESPLVHAEVGVGALLGLDPAGQVLKLTQALGGGELSLLEPPDDLQHAL